MWRILEILCNDTKKSREVSSGDQEDLSIECCNVLDNYQKTQVTFLLLPEANEPELHLVSTINHKLGVGEILKLF